MNDLAFYRSTPGDRTWMTADCLCRNSDVDMHPESGDGVPRAKAVCRPPDKDACPKLAQCLNHALECREVFGVWGGTSQRERAEIWKRRRQTEAA